VYAFGFLLLYMRDSRTIFSGKYHVLKQYYAEPGDSYLTLLHTVFSI